MKKGYIRLWRKVRQSPLMQDHKTFTCFCYLLMCATHKRSAIYMNGTEFILEKGDVAITQQALADALNLTRRETRTCLEKLIKQGRIIKKATNAGTIISIAKWNIYQNSNEDERPTSDQRATNERPTYTDPEECKRREKKRPAAQSIKNIVEWLDNDGKNEKEPEWLN